MAIRRHHDRHPGRRSVQMIPLPRFKTGICLGTLFVLTNVSPVVAQSINWRQDYNAARKEASDKNRPLVLELYTDSCLWCQKLEAGPLRDPTVAGIISEKFVALKINGDRDAGLTTALRIQTYP